MMNRNTSYLIQILVFSCFACWIGWTALAQEAPRKGNSMNTQQVTESSAPEMPPITKAGAISLAARYIGIEESDLRKATASLTSLRERSVPFLHRNLSVRQAWKIQLEDVPLWKNAQGEYERHPYLTNLTVLIDSESGQLISLTSAWPDNVKPIAPYPELAEEERQLTAAGIRYTGLPEKAPTVTFRQALQNCDFWSKDVKQVIAYSVQETEVQYQDRLVWNIQLRGFSPFFASPPRGGSQPPEHARNHIRNVIDASTGEWLGADTVPQPIASAVERQ